LCGQPGLTTRLAALGDGCEVAHIIPKASGGHNGLGNIVLAHTKCNRDMGRRTPRQFWEAAIKGGFDEGLSWFEKIYAAVERPKPSEVKGASGDSLWTCYFNKRDDLAKIEQAKKDIKDIQQMTNRQDAVTKYAARQVMAYLADAIFDGNGLPERGGDRKIFATDGLWTSRFRREWGLFFDSHSAKLHDLSVEEKHLRKEKNRGDHRHHAVDAVITAACWREMQIAWENRDKQADIEGINTANEEAMEDYRRRHPLPPPAPFQTRNEFRDAVRLAVYGDGETNRPICHRPVKRKLIGAFHKETLLGPVLDNAGNMTDSFTAKKSVLGLDPNHLRMPRPETIDEAIDRLAARRQKQIEIEEKAARKWARGVVTSPGYSPAEIDPPPGKSGIVRDVALRERLRTCIKEAGLNPDDFSANEIKKLFESGGFRQASGVPIKSVVLLRTMSDPVLIHRKRIDYATQRMIRDDDPASIRAYVGGNNHHIEIRALKDKKGKEAWSGEIVTSFEAARRKLARLRAIREAGVPKPKLFRKLSEGEREKFTTILREMERSHPLVDRTDNDEKGGRFVMSLCEGEMLFMKHKQTGELGYFVVAKLDKPQSIVLVPHWDARSATERKDAEGKKVADSKREQFAVTPTDLAKLAPPDRPHAVKVRVSPLCVVTELPGD
jgi:CRISPR-associated endonuclease Csn1